jgi:hypothetical protein
MALRLKGGRAEPVQPGEPESRPFRGYKGSFDLHCAGYGQQEEDGGEADPEGHREHVRRDSTKALSLDAPPGADLGPDYFAVELGESSGDARSDERCDHDGWARILVLQGHDQREPNDRAVDDTLDLVGAEVLLDNGEHRLASIPSSP